MVVPIRPKCIDIGWLGTKKRWP